MRIREFRPGDEAALRRVFWSSVHGIACRDYTPEQLNAWAPRHFDEQLWGQRLRRNRPFVVELASDLVAFADVQEGGYIDQFFVAAAVEGQGVGSLLMRHLEQVAVARKVSELSSDVSRTAQPFFERFGFVLVERRVRHLRGVQLPNAFMIKRLQSARQ